MGWVALGADPAGRRERLFLSEKTVKIYVSRILEKLGLHRRAEAGPSYPRSSAPCSSPCLMGLFALAGALAGGLLVHVTRARRENKDPDGPG